jgi:hypothetical protein
MSDTRDAVEHGTLALLEQAEQYGRRRPAVSAVQSLARSNTEWALPENPIPRGRRRFEILEGGKRYTESKARLIRRREFIMFRVQAEALKALQQTPGQFGEFPNPEWLARMFDLLQRIDLRLDAINARGNYQSNPVCSEPLNTHNLSRFRSLDDSRAEWQPPNIKHKSTAPLAPVIELLTRSLDRAPGAPNTV